MSAVVVVLSIGRTADEQRLNGVGRPVDIELELLALGALYGFGTYAAGPSVRVDVRHRTDR